MYASIRRYRTDSVDEVIRRAKEGFLPIISKAPGFLSYSMIKGKDGSLVTASYFESQAGAEESNRTAADWVQKNIADLLGPPEITSGEVAVHKAVEKVGTR